jgi:hypothetical protein
MEHHTAKLFHYLVRSLQNEEDAADLAMEGENTIVKNHGEVGARLIQTKSRMG